MTRVYVAGAYSPTQTGAAGALEMLANMRRGIRVSAELLATGKIYPYCPWSDYTLLLTEASSKIKPEHVYGYSMSFLEHYAEAVYVLPGWKNSTGTKAELKRASLLGIPVFFELENLFKWIDTKDERYDEGAEEPREQTSSSRLEECISAAERELIKHVSGRFSS